MIYRGIFIFSVINQLVVSMRCSARFGVKVRGFAMSMCQICAMRMHDQEASLELRSPIQAMGSLLRFQGALM